MIDLTWLLCIANTNNSTEFFLSVCVFSFVPWRDRNWHAHAAVLHGLWLWVGKFSMVANREQGERVFRSIIKNHVLGILRFNQSIAPRKVLKINELSWFFFLPEQSEIEQFYFKIYGGILFFWGPRKKGFWDYAVQMLPNMTVSKHKLINLTYLHVSESVAT